VFLEPNLVPRKNNKLAVNWSVRCFNERISCKHSSKSCYVQHKNPSSTAGMLCWKSPWFDVWINIICFQHWSNFNYICSCFTKHKCTWNATENPDNFKIKVTQTRIKFRPFVSLDKLKFISMRAMYVVYSLKSYKSGSFYLSVYIVVKWNVNSPLLAMSCSSVLLQFFSLIFHTKSVRFVQWLTCKLHLEILQATEYSHYLNLTPTYKSLSLQRYSTERIKDLWIE
jgi:hypothetical protein